jgi:hypothetical protein
LAGIFLLTLFSFDMKIGWPTIFFLISGLFQLFWVIPLIRDWGKRWYYAGMIGSIISIVIYVEYPVYVLGIAAEVFQAAFIVICGIILWRIMVSEIKKFPFILPLILGNQRIVPLLW